VHYSLSKTLILLLLALVVANVQCFSQCLVASCDSAPTHCHPAGATEAHCSHGHDFMPVSGHAPIPIAVIDTITLPSLDVAYAPPDFPAIVAVENPFLSPPSPLRI